MASQVKARVQPEQRLDYGEEQVLYCDFMIVSLYSYD